MYFMFFSSFLHLSLYSFVCLCMSLSVFAFGQTDGIKYVFYVMGFGWIGSLNTERQRNEKKKKKTKSKQNSILYFRNVCPPARCPAPCEQERAKQRENSNHGHYWSLQVSSQSHCLLGFVPCPAREKMTVGCFSQCPIDCLLSAHNVFANKHH